MLKQFLLRVFHHETLIVRLMSENLPKPPKLFSAALKILVFIKLIIMLDERAKVSNTDPSLSKCMYNPWLAKQAQKRPSKIN